MSHNKMLILLSFMWNVGLNGILNGILAHLNLLQAHGNLYNFEILDLLACFLAACQTTFLTAFMR